jgi:tyrosyl-tRNA synthetase
VEDPEAQVSDDDLVDGTWVVLRRGKKRFAGVEVR